jgi:outer membrane protein OmpA-like peptidoglycan-associated protein
MMSLGWVVSMMASLAHAQDTPAEGFDSHGFRQVAHDGDLRDPLTVQRPGPFDGGDWWLSGLAEYARAPLVEVTEGATPEERQVDPIVDNLVAMNLSAGVAPHERVRVDLLAPIYGLSTGFDEAVMGPAMGDLRGALMLVALRPDPLDGGFGLAAIGEIDVPTGTPSRFLGNPGVAGGGRLAATVETPVVTVTADAGLRFREVVDPDLGLGSDLVTGGLAFGVRTSDTVGFTLEGTTEVPFLDPGLLPGAMPPIETLASVRYVAPSGAFWTFGGAAGLTDAPGVAQFRLVIGGGFAHRDMGVRDVDTIGVLRASDLCPVESETFNGWKDEDGCPDRLGTLGVEMMFRGSARAADAEIIGPAGTQTVRVGSQGLVLDAVPGSSWTIRARDGCLAGEATAVAGEIGTKLTIELVPKHDAKVNIEVVGPSGEPLPGALVAWRSELPDCVPLGTKPASAEGHISQEISPGLHHLIVTATGHTVVEQPIQLLSGDEKTVRIQLAPSKIVVEKRQIRILEKVQFESGRAVIRPASYELLGQVAGVIRSTPGIGRVEVGGHTDNKGSDDFNLKLSKERAAAVREYLIAQGVPESQLLAVGYGETKPIDTNKTDKGREVNRRVEFQLIDQPADKQEGT